MKKEKVNFFLDCGKVLKGIFNYDDDNCDSIMHAIIFFRHEIRNPKFIEFSAVKPIRMGTFGE